MTPAQQQQGFKDGDLDLTLPNRRLLLKDQGQDDVMMAKACALFMKLIKRGSQAEVLMRPSFQSGNYILMLEAFDLNYRSKTLPVMYSLVKKEFLLINSSKAWRVKSRIKHQRRSD